MDIGFADLQGRSEPAADQLTPAKLGANAELQIVDPNAARCERLLHLGGGRTGTLRHIRESVVDIGIADFEAVTLGDKYLEVIVDEILDHLFAARALIG